MFTWMICYNRYVAAVATLRPNRVPSILVHANIIVQPAQMFEWDGWREYDQVVRLQTVTTPNQDWGALNLPLYACTFVAAERRRNVCWFCCSRHHAYRVHGGWIHPCLVPYPVPRHQSAGPGHLTAPHKYVSRS